MRVTAFLIASLLLCSSGRADARHGRSRGQREHGHQAGYVRVFDAGYSAFGSGCQGGRGKKDGPRQQDGWMRSGKGYSSYGFGESRGGYSRSGYGFQTGVLNASPFLQQSGWTQGGPSAGSSGWAQPTGGGYPTGYSGTSGGHGSTASWTAPGTRPQHAPSAFAYGSDPSGAATAYVNVPAVRVDYVRPAPAIYNVTFAAPQPAPAAPQPELSTGPGGMAGMWVYSPNFQRLVFIPAVAPALPQVPVLPSDSAMGAAVPAAAAGVGNGQ
ncbi:MAG: hypothetical protein HY816_09795 [Candidatus Wallbacteria bacterium]|nr:hypothetical protein [Candidatus Wallbacteria bacterium]